MKELKVKGLSLLSAGVMLVSGYVLGNINECKAEGIKTNAKIEESLNSEDTEIEYVEYEVQKGDNASKLSREMCKHYGIEPTNKYWPVIAYLNGYPRMIKPGDTIKYPELYTVTEKLYGALRTSGWLARYIQHNNIYGKNDLNPRYTVADVLEEIYGKKKSQNYTLVEAYLDAIGMNKDFDSDTDVRDPNKLFKLTDWIPTEEELLEYGYNPALNPKSKGKRR